MGMMRISMFLTMRGAPRVTSPAGTAPRTRGRRANTHYRLVAEFVNYDHEISYLRSHSRVGAPREPRGMQGQRRRSGRQPPDRAHRSAEAREPVQFSEGFADPRRGRR